MATKKQRRRREKGRRHEYEYVYVDDEGREVEVEAPEPKPRAEKKPAAAKTAARGQREVPPPSWERTLRRAALFVPVMLIVLYIARPKNGSPVALVVQAFVFVVLMIGLMYGMDSILYRSYQKRLEKRGGSPPKTK